MDPKTIDWKLGVMVYIYGMQKFILKQEVICPTQENSPIIQKINFTYFEDIKFAFFDGQAITKYNLEKIRKDVMSSEYV